MRAETIVVKIPYEVKKNITFVWFSAIQLFKILLPPHRGNYSNINYVAITVEIPARHTNLKKKSVQISTPAGLTQDSFYHECFEIRYSRFDFRYSMYGYRRMYQK